MGISNLTLHEVKQFFKGDLIAELKYGRYYVEQIKGSIYQVKDMNCIVLGYLDDRNK